MAATRPADREAAKQQRPACASGDRPDPPVRTLRSAASSGLIEDDDAQTTAHAACSGHAVLVRATKRRPQDLDRFVAALLAMALAESDDDPPHKKE
jgi:hypothetical protein